MRAHVLLAVVMAAALMFLPTGAQAQTNDLHLDADVGLSTDFTNFNPVISGAIGNGQVAFVASLSGMDIDAFRPGLRYERDLTRWSAGPLFDMTEDDDNGFWLNMDRQILDLQEFRLGGYIDLRPRSGTSVGMTASFNLY